MESGIGTLAMRTVVRRLKAAGRALFPHFCVGCGEEGETVCHGCTAITEAPRKGLFACPGCGADVLSFGARCGQAPCAASPLDGLASAVPYGDPALGKLMRLWKYDRVREAERAATAVYARFLEERRQDLAPLVAGAVVVPVPLHFLRRASRGFNQSETLGAAFAKAFGLTMDPGLLCRAFGGVSQASVDDRAKRLANVAGMFRVSRRLPQGSRAVLIDDVATTGATLRDCARALRTAGAGEVRAVTLLRR